MFAQDGSLAAGLGEEAVDGGEDLRAVRADEAAEGVLAVLLPFLGVLQHRALPVALADPHVRVEQDVPHQLERAHPRHQRHGADQRVHLQQQQHENQY